MEFNKEQEEAINSTKGRVQVIASAGSGKSSTLVERIRHLVEDIGIEEDKILAISFTNASATDLQKKLSEKKLKEVNVGTFHMICKKILEENGYNNLFNSPNIYQIKREIEIVTKEKNINIDDIISWIGYQKNHMLTSNSSNFKPKESVYDISLLRKAYKVYETYCKENNMVDFDDWLILTNEIYEKGYNKQWEYVLVDESQDQNIIQYKLVEHFCKENIFVCGDYFQSLYSFRGASPELFKQFDKEHEGTKVINMNTNYRSRNNIVKASNNFIRPYGEDYEHYKDTIAYNKENGKIECKVYNTRANEAQEVGNKIEKLIEEGIDINEIAVLYRNNSNADCIENELKHRKIEYKITNSNSFFERKEIKGIISVLRLINDITEDEAFEILFKECRLYPTTYYQGTLIDKLKTEAGKKDCTLYEAFIEHRWTKSYEQKNAEIFIDYINRLKIQKEKHLTVNKIIDNIVKMFKVKEWIKEKYEASVIQDKYDSINNLKSFVGNHNLESFLNYCLNGGIKKSNNKDGVSLMTIHGSKGLEFQVVFLIGLEEDKFPSNRASIESEARLMYVGITRAKEQFYLSSIGYSDFYNEYSKGVKEIERE